MSKVVRDYEGCSQEEICQLVEHLLGCTPLTTPPSIVQRHVARIHPRLPWQRRRSAILTFMFISTGAHGAAALRSTESSSSGAAAFSEAVLKRDRICGSDVITQESFFFLQQSVTSCSCQFVTLVVLLNAPTTLKNSRMSSASQYTDAITSTTTVHIPVITRTTRNLAVAEKQPIVFTVSNGSLLLMPFVLMHALTIWNHTVLPATRHK